VDQRAQSSPIGGVATPLLFSQLEDSKARGLQLDSFQQVTQVRSSRPMQAAPSAPDSSKVEIQGVQQPRLLAVEKII
jgi:hypothetical protein